MSGASAGEQRQQPAAAACSRAYFRAEVLGRQESVQHSVTQSLQGCHPKGNLLHCRPCRIPRLRIMYIHFRSIGARPLRRIPILQQAMAFNNLPCHLTAPPPAAWAAAGPPASVAVPAPPNTGPGSADSLLVEWAPIDYINYPLGVYTQSYQTSIFRRGSLNCWHCCLVVITHQFGACFQIWPGA